jgi:putative transposase
VPWKETLPVEEKKRFIEDWLRADVTFGRLCERYGVEEKTGYKWVARFRAGGYQGLEERSRRPLTSPGATPVPVVRAIVEARETHPYWGPRKLVAWLGIKRPELVLPAASTAGEILKRHGLVTPRTRKRRTAPPNAAPFVDSKKPNDTWCADFKGEFTVARRVHTQPLTVSDAVSRYLFRCDALEQTRFVDVKPRLERAFREHGLPLAMRTDNGAPFAATGKYGLSRFAVWLVRLGIRPERIAPGKPYQNGRHERMHLTLQTEAGLPPGADLEAQQAAFDRFRRCFNEERPHEALGQRTPASVHTRSPRPFPARLPEIEYPTNVAVRLVRQEGTVKWHGAKIFVSVALAGEWIAFEPIEDGVWTVRFGPIDLGIVDWRGAFVQNLNAIPRVQRVSDGRSVRHREV